MKAYINFNIKLELSISRRLFPIEEKFSGGESGEGKGPNS